MSELINDGGPAFPQNNDTWFGTDGNPDVPSGMTLRDYFAAKCDVSAYQPLASLRLKKGSDITMQELADYIAILRFMEADAMLSARTGSEAGE